MPVVVCGGGTGSLGSLEQSIRDVEANGARARARRVPMRSSGRTPAASTSAVT
jgi:hypothetical protein